MESDISTLLGRPPATAMRARAPVEPLPKARAIWLRVLASPWLHIVLTFIAVWIYHDLASSWKSETTKPAFGNVPPLYAMETPRNGRDPDATLRLAVPAILAGVWIGVIAALRWRRALPEIVFVIVAAGFVFSLNTTVAMIDDREAITEPFSRTILEYIGDVPDVRDDPVKFVAQYPAINQRLTIHAGTHPPGGVLFLYFVQKWFDAELKTASFAAIIFSSLAIIPAYLFARRAFGRDAAILTAGLYAVTPGLVMFGATSMDGVFVFFPVLGIWLLHEALARRRIGWAILLAVIAGAALTTAMFMTFATLCIGIIYVIYALLSPRKEFLRVLTVLSVTLVSFVAFHFLLYGMTGYDVIAAVFAAVERDARTVGSGTESLSRYLDVSLANFVSFIITAGIATIAIFLRGIGRHTLISAFAIGIVVISFSTLFTLETERIWIFLTPFVLAGAAWRLTRYRVLPYIVIALTFVQTWLMELLLYTHW